jgi:hypothetical protein
MHSSRLSDEKFREIFKGENFPETFPTKFAHRFLLAYFLPCVSGYFHRIICFFPKLCANFRKLSGNFHHYPGCPIHCTHADTQMHYFDQESSAPAVAVNTETDRNGRNETD